MPTPAERVDCVHCGDRSAEAAAAEQEAVKADRFIRAFINRPSPFTFLFVGINLGVFALEWLVGGMSALSADPSVLRAMGAKDAALIDGAHQYWRLVTAIFIHIGFLHVLFNNYALWIIGQEIERIYGSARFVTLYLATGLASMAASYYFSPESLSAGASGSIFGLFGVMMAFAIRYKKELPKVLSADITRRIVPVILINLLFGFSVRIVDNAAHIGGLLSGIALAFIVPYKRLDEAKTAGIWRTLQIICLAAITVSFVAAFRNYDGPRPSLANLKSTPGDPVMAYLKGVQTATDGFEESINSMEAILNRKDPSGDTRDAKDAIERATRALNSIPPIDERADAYKQRFLELVIEERNIIEQYAGSNQKQFGKTYAAQNALVERFEEFYVNDFTPWLAGFLKERGYKIHKGGSDN